MLTFDAITGNDDRHFYNWGIIDNKKKTKKLPKFAPVFDSARGLFWNWSDSNIKTQNLAKNGRKIIKYIDNSSPRVTINSNCNATHFELIKYIKDEKNEYKKLIDELSSLEKEMRVLNMLQREFYPLFIY